MVSAGSRLDAGHEASAAAGIALWVLSHQGLRPDLPQAQTATTGRVTGCSAPSSSTTSPRLARSSGPPGQTPDADLRRRSRGRLHLRLGAHALEQLGRRTARRGAGSRPPRTARRRAARARRPRGRRRCRGWRPARGRRRPRRARGSTPRRRRAARPARCPAAILRDGTELVASNAARWPMAAPRSRRLSPNSDITLAQASESARDLVDVGAVGRVEPGSRERVGVERGCSRSGRPPPYSSYCSSARATLAASVEARQHEGLRVGLLELLDAALRRKSSTCSAGGVRAAGRRRGRAVVGHRSARGAGRRRRRHRRAVRSAAGRPARSSCSNWRSRPAAGPSRPGSHSRSSGTSSKPR